MRKLLAVPMSQEPIIQAPVAIKQELFIEDEVKKWPDAASDVTAHTELNMSIVQIFSLGLREEN